MKPRPLRICLAASGGGHLRQLLDLEPVWGVHDHFFVTTAYALGKSVACEHRTHFVQEYGFGMWRQGRRIKMIKDMIINIIQAIVVIIRERPNMVITTGAAAIYWPILFARLSGAKLVSIESFARFEAPSVYGKLVRPFAQHLVVQSSKLKAHWPEAKVFDPLKSINTPRPAKESLAFVTVGALTPFDRMVGAVVGLKEAGGLAERLLVQTGTGSRFMANGGETSDIQMVESLDFSTIQDVLRRAELVICHGGTGSIITALREGCRVIVMPRRFANGEAFDDHQKEIVSAFAARGLIEAVYDEADLAVAISRARARPPVSATTDPQELRQYLNQLITA